jgi:hypothetical protein
MNHVVDWRPLDYLRKAVKKPQRLINISADRKVYEATQRNRLRGFAWCKMSGQKVVYSGSERCERG